MLPDLDSGHPDPSEWPTVGDLVERLPFELNDEDIDLVADASTAAGLWILATLGDDARIWRHVGADGIFWSDMRQDRAIGSNAMRVIEAAEDVAQGTARVSLDEPCRPDHLTNDQFEAVIKAMRIRRAGHLGAWR